MKILGLKDACECVCTITLNDNICAINIFVLIEIIEIKLKSVC